ncbi:MAG: hypothetical protein HKL81_04425 [Acidimicrobiaceae bacterium]|nr:hypothetical protein [Acidimicrobiaceae bacterium]
MLLASVGLVFSAAATLMVLRYRNLAYVSAVIGLVELGLLGDLSGSDRQILTSLASALAFLITAAPLGLMLDRVGFFKVLAEAIPRRDATPYLWALAALTTAIFNLDAAVVLLTPLYIRYAQSTGRNAIAFGFQPVVLSLLASSPLVGSNLTNLIAFDYLRLSTGSLLYHMAPPSAAGCVVGYFLWKRCFRGTAVVPDDKVELRRPYGELLRSKAVRIGLPITLMMLAGMLFGPGVGIAPWEVAALCDLILIVSGGGFKASYIPLPAALAAGGLGICAVEVGGRLNISGFVTHQGNFGWLLLSLGSGTLALVINNLPGLAAILAAAHSSLGNSIWPVLLGVNILPGIAVTGTLANILWFSVVSGFKLDITLAGFSKVMFKIVGPSFLSAFLVLVLLRLFSR